MVFHSRHGLMTIRAVTRLADWYYGEDLESWLAHRELGIVGVFGGRTVVTRSCHVGRWWWLPGFTSR